MLNRTYDAFLFDMDGTLLNSIPSAERAWGAWARRHGLDVEAFLPTIHGVRAIETITRLNLPGVDPQQEVRELTKAEVEDTDGTVPIAGAIDFLRQLPPERWAIVTSAPPELVAVRMAVAGLPRPDILVTSADVTNGKPAPDCFLLGAQRLGVDPRRCLVFEDAISGIRAAEAAGADVMIIRATHAHPVPGHHPQIESYDELDLRVTADGLSLAGRG